jgi:hypothetical protein
MPQLQGTTAFPAGSGPVNLIAGWQYEYLPWPARLKVLMRTSGVAATGGLRFTVTSGSEQIVEESPIQGGGTAGVTPAELNTPPVVFDGPGGDRLKLNVRSADTAALSVDWIIYAYPLR